VSVIAAALKHMLAAGMQHDAIVAAVEAMEAARTVEPVRTARQERNARYYEARKARLEASENRLNASCSSETSETLSLPPSPQTPQPPTHTRGGVTTGAHEGDDWPAGETANEHAARLVTMDRNLDTTRRQGLILTMGEVARWRQLGWSWELDVVPVVRAHGQRAGPDPVSTWKFFTEAIGRAHAARTRPAETFEPQVRHERTGSRPPREAAYADRLSDIDRAMAEACK